MKSWTPTVQHTLGVCLLAATCGCVGPRPPATLHANDGGELHSALPANSEARAESMARYSVAVGQGWNWQGDAAISNFLRAAEADPENLKLQVRVAFELLGDDRAEEANKLMERMAARRPNSDQAQLWAAYFARATRQPEKAIERYDRAIKLAPDSPAAYIEKATTLIRMDRGDEAIETLQTAIKRGVTHEDIPPLLGQLFIRQIIAIRDPAQMAKSATGAVNALMPLFTKFPRDATLMIEIAVLQKFSGDNEGSLKTFADNADILPGDSRWRQRQVGMIFRGDLDPALQAARRLVEKNPTNANYLLTLGHIEEQTRNPKAAEAAYRKATKLAPDDNAPIIRLGLLLNTQDRSEEAAKLFTQALARRPDDAPILELMAYLEITRNRPKEALVYFERVAAQLTAPYETALTPYFETSYVLTCLQAGETEKAAQLIHAHLNGSEDLVEVLFSLLVVEKDQDRVKQGILAFQRVSELSRTRPISTPISDSSTGTSSSIKKPSNPSRMQSNSRMSRKLKKKFSLRSFISGMAQPANKRALTTKPLSNSRNALPSSRNRTT
ncbi:MAG: tetratricopeptide repeat protein [Kiritimatiellae bacterium]|nr:tetratricopeptide repeat protein [Kiritimatiellia bacterium]